MRARTIRRVLAAAAGAAVFAACSSSTPASVGPTVRGTSTTTVSSRSSTTRGVDRPAPVATSKQICGNRGRKPLHYRSVVVFAFENRTWDAVGLGFGTRMPYLHRLGRQCSFFTDWTEADTTQNSLSQYVGQISGAPQPGTRNDCAPSSACSTRADNLFRQAARAGLTAVNYVEGATAPCSASGNAAKHVPALYLRGARDTSRCTKQVRPLGDLDPQALPAFAFITPDLCNDGHDCSDAIVDRWAAGHIQPILASHAYRNGEVAVFVWYDEDHPVPNMWITPTAKAGAIHMRGAGYAGTLRAWEEMLGLPCLARACTAADMRNPSNS